jgi:hypothetical protein
MRSRAACSQNRKQARDSDQALDGGIAFAGRVEHSQGMRGMLLLVSLGVAAATAGASAQSDLTTKLVGLRPALHTEPLERELGPLNALPFYDLDLTLKDDLSGYALAEEVVFTNTSAAPLPDVMLRLFGNSASEPPLIAFQGGECVARECTVTSPSPTLIRVQPRAALEPGAVLRIRVRLHGTLRAIDSTQTDMLTQGLESMGSLLSGDRTSDYGLLSLGDGIASLANFYAVLAHRKGRNWITSEGRALGDLGAEGVSFVHAVVRAPRAVTLASTGVISENLAVSDPQHRIQTVNASLVRDFALVASRDWVVQARQVGDVTVRAYFLERDAVSGGQVLDTAAQALAAFERRFGPYPYTDLDVAEAALVGGAGGAEFSGLVSIASMLYRPLTVDKSALSLLGGSQGSALEFTTAHEVAHQFWYGLVGSDAREHPFVDESLTQWSAMLYFEDRFGVERANQEGDAQIRMNYRLMRLLGQPDGAVDRPVDAFETSLAYAGLVYGKGAYLYAALRKLCGDEAFFSALQSYARRYRFQQAPPQAFIDGLAKGSKDATKIRLLAKRWLEQSHADADLGAATLESMLSSGTSTRSRTAMPAGATGLAGLGNLAELLQSVLGGQVDSGAKRKHKGKAVLDERALNDLLGQLKGNTSGSLPRSLQDLVGGLLGQVDDGIDQLPMPSN